MRRLFLRKPSARRMVWVSLAGMFLMMVAYQLFGANGLAALHRKHQEERGWQQRNQELERQNGALQQRIHELKTDRRAIEKIAREELLMADPREEVIVERGKK